MPLYEYRCTSCGRRTEVLQRLGSAPLSQCPHCGGPLEKLLSAPALQFKGTGWYVTDYANRKASGESSASTPADGAKPEKGSESKPAAKPVGPDPKAKAS
ncbi:MAG TPA: FmdB family zinc ribbon protein [Thermoanaerobaculaceae bacterium]|nr:FmdB family zinc ribbon protein [Thermoanaerobaculaceae bacterium]